MSNNLDNDKYNDEYNELNQIKEKFGLIYNQNFEIKNYKKDLENNIEIWVHLPNESFDVYVYTNLDKNKYMETSYYCAFHNNKREFDFSIKDIYDEGSDMIHNMPNFVEIFRDQLNFWLIFDRD